MTSFKIKCDSTERIQRENVIFAVTMVTVDGLAPFIATVWCIQRSFYLLDLHFKGFDIISLEYVSILLQIHNIHGNFCRFINIMTPTHKYWNMPVCLIIKHVNLARWDRDKWPLFHKRLLKKCSCTKCFILIQIPLRFVRKDTKIGLQWFR